MQTEKKKKIIFIINPIAGVGGKRRLEKKIDEFFADSDYQVVKHFTCYPSHAVEIADSYAKAGPSFIVAVGGDGTINEIARSLINTGSTLGVIPLGSGNGFARHFNLPFNLDRALNVLINGNEISADVGYLNGKPFFCTAGIGFDAETGYYYRNYTHRGFVSYLLSFAKVFGWYKAREYEIEIDGEQYSFNAFFITIANISQFGYNFYVAPRASTTDGYFDVVVVQKFPKWMAIAIALRSFVGTIHKSRYVWYRQAHHVNIRSKDRENIIHIDGEAGIMNGSLDYTIQKGSLKVIINREGIKKALKFTT
jgi:YegS/Rv2252/BmrU family lipid kinase